MEDSGERLPVIVSGTVTDASGRILSRPDGGRVLAFGAPRAAAGRRLELRARRGADAALHRGAGARSHGDTFISCYPNAGLPNPMSETGFDETPDVTGALMEEFAARAPEHRGRLLRHHARAHRRDRAPRRRLPAAHAPRSVVHAAAGGLIGVFVRLAGRCCRCCRSRRPPRVRCLGATRQ